MNQLEMLPQRIVIVTGVLMSVEVQSFSSRVLSLCNGGIVKHKEGYKSKEDKDWTTHLQARSLLI